jgi:hypothetical protein
VLWPQYYLAPYQDVTDENRIALCIFEQASRKRSTNHQPAFVSHDEYGKPKFWYFDFGLATCKPYQVAQQNRGRHSRQPQFVLQT